MQDICNAVVRHSSQSVTKCLSLAAAAHSCTPHVHLCLQMGICDEDAVRCQPRHHQSLALDKHCTSALQPASRQA